MIIYGQYLKSNGTFRPYLKALVLSSNGVYTDFPFIIDTGADHTFLPYSAITLLDIDIAKVTVEDDVSGVGGQATYFNFGTELVLIADADAKVFAGEIGIFLSPHCSNIPLLGRDILDYFTVIFDRRGNKIILFDEMHSYSIS